jgi:alkaline phosphatase D
VLDGRQYRSVQPCPAGRSRRGRVAPETCPDFADPSRSLLGAAQETWLYEGFARSEARWNLVAQQLLFSAYVQKAADGALGVFTDSWSAYAPTRDRVISAIAGSKLKNPVIIGGDIHAFLAADVKADFRRAGSPTVASEFVTTSVTSDRMPDSFAETLPLNPHVRFLDNRPRGYLAVDVTRDRMEVRLQAISDRTDRSAATSMLKSFVVQDGRPGLQSN